MRGKLAAGLLTLLALAGLGAGCDGSEDSRASASAGLNVVLVVSDDQTLDSVGKMPWLSRRADWAVAKRGYVNQPWCCPSRASILSGRFAHEHGVVGNSRYAREFDDSATIATALDDAGYETGLFGKYLNGFPWDHPQTFVPEGWDSWAAFLDTNGAYYDYSLGIDGRRVAERGHAARDHSTDLIARRALRFVRDAPEPFFAMVTPFAPHEPAVPAPGDRGAFADAPVPEPPNFNRVAPDQPEYFQERREVRFERVEDARRRAWAATLAVDRATRRLFTAVRRRDALDRTVFVYISDNGFSFGSHRFMTKNCLYEECAHVPLAFRMPAGDGGMIDAPVSNVDLAPTLAALGGAEPLPDADGESLAPQLLGEEPWAEDRDLLLEVHASKQGVPEGYAIVNSRWKYIELDTGEVELYDLRADPYELDNLAGDPAVTDVEADLAGRLDELAP